MYRLIVQTLHVSIIGKNKKDRSNNKINYRRG